jgi:OmpA-OmpF porin, OOP family
MKRILTIVLACILAAAAGSAQQKDDKDCRDHPLFTRMPDSWIHHCDQREFNAYEFRISPTKTQRIEGKYWKISYYPQASLKVKPSELQILRNFENAVQSVGGKSLYAEKSRETFQLFKDGKEIWIEVTAEFTGKYGLTVLEKTVMNQDVVANAGALLAALKTTGHAAVGGIYFDTGKSSIKPESDQAIGEVAKLLKSDPALSVYVVGHTDNAGGLESNMKLSQARADAVQEALVRTYGIAPGRLKSFGNGPYAPVASNDAEEGRARNRRVELVKQ